MNKTYLNSQKNTVLSLKPSRAIQLLLMVLFVYLIPLVSFGQSPQPFIASGTFVVPAGVTSITVQAWGAGGAGGGSTNAGTNTARGGAGGGGGAYATATLTVTPGAILSVVVGVGGTGASAANGGAGGFSTITGYTGTIYAAGGSGGTANTGGGSPAGGAGGTLVASKGSPVAGTNGGNGNTGYGITSGDGGAGANGGGPGGASIDDTGDTSNGNAGAQPGGGGSGSRTSQNGGNQAGGAGGAGRVIISWCTAPVGLSYTLSSPSYCVGSAITTNSPSFTTVGNPAATYSVSPALPAGLSINASTGAITGIPTAAVAATNYTVTATNSCGNTTKVLNITVNASLTITTAGTVTAVCQSAGAQTTTMAYTATTGTPTSYSIDWLILTDQGSTAFAFATGAGSITGVIVPAGTAVGTYTGTMTITNASGCTATKAVTLTVNPILTASVSIAASPSTSICYGTSVTFTATPTNGGTTPVYQWKLNGANVGSNATTYTNATLLNSDVVTCIMTSNATPCLTGSPATSNSVSITLLGPAATGVTICAGNLSGASTSLTSPANCSTVTVGPKDAGNGDGTGGSGSNWSNDGNITSNDNSYAVSDINTLSKNLVADTFGFSIPAGATISGVQVTIGRYGEDASSLSDNNVRLVVGGTATGTNKKLGGNWPSSEAAANYGSTSDLWGATLTPAIINAANFGVILNISNSNSSKRMAYVDYIQISVTYTLSATLDWYTVSSGGTKIGSGASFSPVGVTGSGLANTNTAGTTTYYAACSSNASCRTPVNFVINAVTATPAITLTQPNCSVATGTVTINTPVPAVGMVYTVVGPSPAVTSVSNSTGVFSGLAVGTYSVTAQAASSCVSSATSAVISSAVTKTWNGTAWSPIGTPTKDNLVIINGNYNTSSNGDLSACSLIINSGFKLTIWAGSFVTIQNDLTVTGTLDVLDKGSLVMVNNAGTVTNTGTTNIRRITTPFKLYDYTYWSTPVFSTTIATTFPTWNIGNAYEYLPPNFFDGNGDNIDDDNNDWSQVSTMTAAKGYIIMVPTPTTGPGSNNPSEVVFSGKVNNGVQKVTGVITGGTYLVGNPYPSAIDADAFINYNAGVIDGTLYFWTHNTAIQLASGIGAGKAGSGRYAFTSDDYASYNLVGGVGVASKAISLGALPTGKIGSCQAFFTTTNGTIVGTNEIVFNNAMRLGSGGATLDNSQFFKTKRPKGTVEKNRIWLNLSNEEGAFKQTLLGYVTGATNENEGLFDGESFDGNDFIDFYSVNQDKNLVIQGRALPFDENDEVPLGYSTIIEGTFNINIEQADGLLMNQDVFIEDKLTNTEFDLKKGNYTFDTEVGTFNDRFVLKYKSSSKSLGTGDFNSQIINKTLVAVKNKQIKINSFAETIDKVVIYDVLGRQIYKKDNINSSGLSITDLVSSNQALIVKTTLQNGTTTTDKIVY